jgi:two-component system sensor histidine kinase KdpD
LVDTAIDRVRPLLQGRFISRDIASDLPQANADRALTESAIANVLNNAARYCPEEATILVRARHVEDKIELDVIDEGPGFSQRALEQLFTKFSHGVEGDGRPAGAGLGLAVAKGFIEAQGGRIEASNRVDRSGAIVRVWLPSV